MLRTLSARDANQQFSKLLAEVAAGETVVITRRGVPVARLVPEPAPDGRRRLTPEQERALDESEAWARSLPIRDTPYEPFDRDAAHARGPDVPE